MNDSQKTFDISIIRKSKSSLKAPLKRLEDLKLLKNPLSKVDSKLEKKYNILNRLCSNLIKSKNINFSPEHYNIYKELLKIKGLDISTVSIPEIANLDLPNLQIGITKSKISLENSKLELSKLRKFYENFDVEERERENQIRSEIKWFNKTLYNRDIDSIKLTTENLYNDIIENITLINNRVQEDIGNKKMQLQLRTENIFDFTNLKNNTFLKKTLKSQEGMVKILYTFTQEMGKIRSNYENIRKRIKKYNEANLKYNSRIEDENLKMEKIKSDMMRYKIEINKMKTNNSTNNMKKTISKELKKIKHQRKESIYKNKYTLQEIFQKSDEFKNNSNNKRIKSARINIDSSIKNLNRNYFNLNNSNDHQKSTNNKNLEKINKNFFKSSKKNICHVNNLNIENIKNEEIKEKIFEEIHFQSPVFKYFPQKNLKFEEPTYDDAANKYINYVFSSNQYDKNLDEKKLSKSNISNENFKKSKNKNNFKDNEIKIKNLVDKSDQDSINIDINNEEENQNNNKNLPQIGNYENKYLEAFKRDDLNIKEEYQIQLNDKDNNIVYYSDNFFSNSKDDLLILQKQSIINIIDNNPKIGNTIQHLTNTLSFHRNKLNKLLKEQTDFLFNRNKLQDIVFKLINKFRNDLKQNDNFVYNSNKNLDIHKNVMKTNSNLNNEGNNPSDIENIASERRKFIDLIVNDKNILLSFYDDKFPKVNSMNKKLNIN